MWKLTFERKWMVMLNRPNLSSVTQHHHLRDRRIQLCSWRKQNQAKPVGELTPLQQPHRWFSESCRAARTPLLASDASCALLTVHSCVHIAEFLSSFHFLPSPQPPLLPSALDTGQRRTCSSHSWFMDQTACVNYRGSPHHNRRLANIDALSLCHWGWMSCSIQDFYFILFPTKSDSDHQCGWLFVQHNNSHQNKRNERACGWYS